MQNFTKQKYLYFIALMLIITTFLPLVFHNLPPFIRSHHLYRWIWAISLLFFHPQILIDRTIQWLIAYFLLILGATNTIWINMDERNYIFLFDEFYDILTGVSVITYFFQTRDFISLAKLTRWAFVFLIITAIMTIITSIIDPEYARNITGIGAISELSQKHDIVLGYKKYGGGTYSTAAAFMCLFPILIFYFKNIKKSLISKIQIIIISILIFFALLGMQIFTNILIAFLVTLLAFLSSKKNTSSLIVISVLIILASFIPKSVYIKNITTIGNYFDSKSVLYSKFKDLALYIKIGDKKVGVKTGIGGRADRYPLLWKSFKKSPFLGCYSNTTKQGNGYNLEGAHIYWMNKLTVTGIIGFLFFFIIIFSFIKDKIQYFDSEYKYYYIIASFSILAYGFFKVIMERDTWYAFFILLPGLFYLPLLKKQKDINLIE